MVMVSRAWLEIRVRSFREVIKDHAIRGAGIRRAGIDERQQSLPHPLHVGNPAVDVRDLLSRPLKHGPAGCTGLHAQREELGDLAKRESQLLGALHEANAADRGGGVLAVSGRGSRRLRHEPPALVVRLMPAACLRLGGLLNQAELGRDTGIPAATLHRYLNLLETSFQLVRLEPYAVNRTKRLVKSPKLYWTDSALALHLSGEVQPRGAHLENLELTDLLAWREVARGEPQVLFWRAHSGEEVDFVIEAGARLLPVEVKAAARVRHHDARHLLTFREQYGDAVHGALLLHTGNDAFWVADRVLAAPWWRVL
jgi:hypothetical protein